MSIAKRSLIIAFCLWHMAAIAAYALPDTIKKISAIGWLHANVSDATRDYVQMTSQWQKWPLFAPNPLRRVIVFIVEVQKEGEWVSLKRIAPDTLEGWNSSSELKTIRKLEEEDGNLPIRKRYAQEVCRHEGVPAGTPIRLRIDFFVIPKHDKPQPIAVWRAWQPQWQTKVDEQIVCPDAETFSRGQARS